MAHTIFCNDNEFAGENFPMTETEDKLELEAKRQIRNSREKERTNNVWRIGIAIILVVIVALLVWIGLRLRSKDENKLSEMLAQSEAFAKVESDLEIASEKVEKLPIFTGGDCEENASKQSKMSNFGTVQSILINAKVIETFCTFDGWTVIQSRGQFNNSNDYFSNKFWDDYKQGFGTPDQEYWIGLDNIFQLTQVKNYSMRITMETFEGLRKRATYKKFKLTENVTYSLDVGGYSGDAGDALLSANGSKFSTKDNDNDAVTGSCAQVYLGAWWYTGCHQSNLNGFNFGPVETPYAQGIVWYPITAYNHSLATVEMAIKAAS